MINVNFSCLLYFGETSKYDIATSLYPTGDMKGVAELEPVFCCAIIANYMNIAFLFEVLPTS